MLKINQIDMRATISIDDKDVAYLSASVQDMGAITISQTISDRIAYLDNKEICENAYNEFETKVEEYIKEI